MKRILLILTGGTIGSFEKNGIISAHSDKCRITEIYSEKFPEMNIEFVTEVPYNILSENLDVKNWEILIDFILSYDYSRFDGIIITHGSDTLSFSSAMLGMCLHGLEIPVVITASDYIPDDPRSNALVNFTAAINLIGQMKSGVYTVYKNPTGNNAEIFIPTQLKSADRINDTFLTANNLSLADIDNDGKINEYSNHIQLHDLQNCGRFSFGNKLHLKKKVKLIYPYPSLNYDDIVIDEDTGAVLHITYHSGTVSQQALTLLKKCKEKTIPMFLCSLKSSSRSLYETSSFILKNGALPLYDIGTESAYAKLLLAINLFPDSIIEFMKKDIYFEQTSQRDAGP